MTRHAPVKRNVGIAPHIDRWVENFARRRGTSYTGAVNALLVAGLDVLDPTGRDAPPAELERGNDDQR